MCWVLTHGKYFTRPNVCRQWIKNVCEISNFYWTFLGRWWWPFLSWDLPPAEPRRVVRVWAAGVRGGCPVGLAGSVPGGERGCGGLSPAGRARRCRRSARLRRRAAGGAAVPCRAGPGRAGGRYLVTAARRGAAIGWGGGSQSPSQRPARRHRPRAAAGGGGAGAGASNHCKGEGEKQRQKLQPHHSDEDSPVEQFAVAAGRKCGGEKDRGVTWTENYWKKWFYSCLCCL